MQTYYLICAFIFGACIGSFLNVLIYRLPREIDTKFKRSYCPKCETPIAWYFNIPILSFIFLRAKCRSCGQSISWRYPLVELLTGLSAVWFLPNQLSLESMSFSFFYFSVFCIFLTHTLIDLRHKILPDSLTIYLAALLMVFSFYAHNWIHWLLGGIVGFTAPFSVTWIFYKLRGQVGLGGGDIKLFAVLGLYLGPVGILQNMFWSCMLGAVLGIALILLGQMKRSNPLPFGPFILAVASLQIFFPFHFQELNKIVFNNFFRLSY